MYFIIDPDRTAFKLCIGSIYQMKWSPAVRPLKGHHSFSIYGLWATLILLTVGNERGRIIETGNGIGTFYVGQLIESLG